MLITQLKDTEVIKSLAGGKVFLLCCHGCKEVSFPEHDGEGLEKELTLTGKKVTDYICNPENLKVRLEGCVDAIESADAVSLSVLPSCLWSALSAPARPQ